MLIFKALYNYVPRPTCGNEIKCCQEPFCVGVFGTDSFLAKPRRKTFLVVFGEMVWRWSLILVVYFPSLLPPPPSACQGPS